MNLHFIHLFSASNCYHYLSHCHLKNIIFPVKRGFTQFYKKITQFSLPGISNICALRNQGLHSIPSYADTLHFMSRSLAEVGCRYIYPRGYNAFPLNIIPKCALIFQTIHHVTYFITNSNKNHFNIKWSVSFANRWQTVSHVNDSMGSYSVGKTRVPLCEGNPPVKGGFPSQRPVTRALTFICFFFLRDAGDLKRHRAHYGITVMRSGTMYHSHWKIRKEIKYSDDMSLFLPRQFFRNC